MNIMCNNCGKLTPHSDYSCQYCHAPIDIPRPTIVNNSASAYLAWLRYKGYPPKFFNYYKTKSVEWLKENFKNYDKEKVVTIFHGEGDLG